MVRWPKFVPAAVLAALGTAAPAQDSQSWLQQVMEPFASTCIDGRPPANAAEVSRDEIPRVLRNHYGRVESARYLRLGGNETLYLLQVTNPSRRVMSRRFRSACAIAVPSRRRLSALFDAVNQLEPRAAAAFGRDIFLSGVLADGWVVVAISHPAES